MLGAAQLVALVTTNITLVFFGFSFAFFAAPDFFSITLGTIELF